VHLLSPLQGVREGLVGDPVQFLLRLGVPVAALVQQYLDDRPGPLAAEELDRDRPAVAALKSSIANRVTVTATA
jgi:hypothetical protein